MRPQRREPARATPGITDRPSGESGAGSTLTIVVLTPLVVALALVGFQASMWAHASARARVIAHTAAVDIARSSLEPATVRALALESLAEQSSLSDVELAIETDGEQVLVVISARLPGLIRGISVERRTEIVLPVEGWRE